MTNAKLILQAEQQLTGYSHARRGYTLIQLIESMNLTKEEWVKMKKDYGLEYLSDEEKQEIDTHLGCTA